MLITKLLFMYMYKLTVTDPETWSVGFYTPTGAFYPDSDHTKREDAAQRVNYLNGGNGFPFNLGVPRPWEVQHNPPGAWDKRGSDGMFPGGY
jgi:hypothetical protein